MQLNPQAVPLQVADPFVGLLHMLQPVPQQEVVLLAAHMVPLVWNPKLQSNPQVVPLQLAVAFAGGAHGVHDDGPQLLVLLFG